MEKKILGVDGKEIVLNAMELKIANNVQRQVENAGFEIDITTLTTIMKSVIEQKFFTVPFADYVPVKVGEGAWSSTLTSFRSYSTGDDFSSGVINTGTNNSRMASADTMIDPVHVPVANWGKIIGWSLFELQQASKSLGNWDIVVAKEKSRKKNWDLGLQRLAFLGLKGSEDKFPGLLNQPGITEDTTTLTTFIKELTSTNFAELCANLVQAYRLNCDYTVYPTHFVMPEADFNGLAAPLDPQFPIKTKLQALEEMFQMMTMNKSFKILPVAYANKAVFGTKNVYVLLNYEEDSVRLDIPVNYTNTIANSTDNFNFQNVGYGQFTGVKAYRPKEMLYFTHTV